MHLLRAAVLAAFLLSATACGLSSALVRADISALDLTPNGDGVGDGLLVEYEVSRPSFVTILLVDGQERVYTLRERELRPAGAYQTPFDGTHRPDAQRLDRRILPNGTYRWVVRAEEEPAGVPHERSGTLTIHDARTNYPRIGDLVAQPQSITPNGDAQDDEMNISYALSTPARVEIFVTNAAGERSLLQPPDDQSAALYSHRWNGTSVGKLLPEGQYVLHVVASDSAGNVSEGRMDVAIAHGGLPRLEIRQVTFKPPAVAVGNDLEVEIRVRNAGDVPLRTMGPPPGTRYTTETNFNSFRGPDPASPPLYFERAGFWRVGVDWGLSGRPFPARWGLTSDLHPLLPGEEAVITGTIQVLIGQTREVFFWAGVAQEGVGFPGGQVGVKPIVVSY